MRRAVSVLLALSCFASPAAALVVPLSGWVPIGGNADHWQDAQGSCLLKEEKYGQAFPELKTNQAALALANRLRTALQAKGLTEVITQPLQRQDNTWAILASYGYQEGGVTYRISQLYLSQSGLLKTLSGSSAVNNTSTCAVAMRDFIRAQVN